MGLGNSVITMGSVGIGMLLRQVLVDYTFTYLLKLALPVLRTVSPNSE